MIRHKAGHTNANADALSRNDLCTISDIADSHFESPSIERVKEICVAQKGDIKLVGMFRYLEQSVLPTDEKLARKIVMESSKYEVIKGFFNFKSDSSLCASQKGTGRPF